MEISGGILPTYKYNRKIYILTQKDMWDKILFVLNHQRMNAGLVEW